MSHTTGLPADWVVWNMAMSQNLRHFLEVKTLTAQVVLLKSFGVFTSHRNKTHWHNMWNCQFTTVDHNWSWIGCAEDCRGIDLFILVYIFQETSDNLLSFLTNPRQPDLIPDVQLEVRKPESPIFAFLVGFSFGPARRPFSCFFCFVINSKTCQDLPGHKQKAPRSWPRATRLLPFLANHRRSPPVGRPKIGWVDRWHGSSVDLKGGLNGLALAVHQTTGVFPSDATSFASKPVGPWAVFSCWSSCLKVEFPGGAIHRRPGWWGMMVFLRFQWSGVWIGLSFSLLVILSLIR